MSAQIAPHLSDDEYADLLVENLIQQAAKLAQFCFAEGLNDRGIQATTAAAWLKTLRRQCVVAAIDQQDKARAQLMRSACNIQQFRDVAYEPEPQLCVLFFVWHVQDWVRSEERRVGKECLS